MKSRFGNRLLVFFISIAVFGSASGLVCQDNMFYARKAAQELHQGTLVVRVFTNAGKIRQLRSLIDAEGISVATRKKLEKQLHDTQKENDAYWNDLRYALTAHYSFSNLLYMPDSLYKSFDTGLDEVFWDEHRNVSPHIKADRSSYFLLIAGDNPDQLILTTRDLVRLDKPFPHRISTFLPSFRRIFNRKAYLEKQVKGFQEKLSALTN
jgi:hypothetical protein